jgi:hypothetical protein
MDLDPHTRPSDVTSSCSSGVEHARETEMIQACNLRLSMPDTCDASSAAMRLCCNHRCNQPMIDLFQDIKARGMSSWAYGDLLQSFADSRGTCRRGSGHAYDACRRGSPGTPAARCKIRVSRYGSVVRKKDYCLLHRRCDEDSAMDAVAR